MKETMRLLFGIDNFVETAERAGIREGDSNAFDIANIVTTARFDGIINDVEMAMLMYCAGYLHATNEAREEQISLFEIDA